MDTFKTFEHSTFYPTFTQAVCDRHRVISVSINVLSADMPCYYEYKTHILGIFYWGAS
jgi:protein involved in sex pheromone biosynthesis